MSTRYDPDVGAKVEESDFFDGIEPSYVDETDEQKEARLSHEAYREAAKTFLAVMLAAVDFLRKSKSDEIRFRTDLISYIFAHPDVAGLSMEELGAKHDRTRGAVSVQILNFERKYNVPEILSQKLRETRAIYHQRRKQKCKTITTN
jgi:hypothetical protein